MGREEYTERVLAVMRRANQGERDAIRAELDAHMEDHMACLLELGYSEALAEERTMAAMGDPEEVGRELDKQYGSRFWTILEGIAVFTLIAVIFQAIIGIGILFHARDSIVARIDPPDGTGLERVYATEELDIRIPIGNDILRVTRISIGERRGEYVAETVLCNYDRIPGGIATSDLIDRVIPENQRGESRWDGGRGGGGGSYGAEYGQRYADIDHGDSYITLRYDAYGEQFTLELPLPEVTP